MSPCFETLNENYLQISSGAMVTHTIDAVLISFKILLPKLTFAESIIINSREIPTVRTQ